MASGTVKWFNVQKGFGFITPNDGGKDAFVHISAVERAGLGTLREGQKVSYELVSDRKTGKILWEREAPRARVEKLDTRNGPAGPTPATDGANVYVFFADFGLLSYDVDGKERWQLPLGQFNNLYGMGASPVLVDDMVVLACDQNTDSFIVAVSQRDGRVQRGLLLGAGVTLMVAWMSGTVAGVLGGSALGDPADYGLDAMFPALFLALLVGQLDGPRARAAALFGGVIALALTPLVPPGLPIVAAALGAVFALTVREVRR